MKTDAQLQQDVLSELSWDPAINASRVTVEVEGGHVTLEGHVASYTEKLRAERVVQQVSGVKSVTVAANVDLTGASRQSDADIARSARKALQWIAYGTKDAVRIVVYDGRVTLSGELDWDWQRRSVVSAVSHVAGILDISDRMLIKFQPSSGEVKSDIEAALERRAFSDPQKICVKVRGSNVTLTGSVRSWSDRELAENCAWSAPGVRSVADYITVSC